MGLTIGLTQLKRKKKQDGTIPIHIRVTEDGKSRYRTTEISVIPKDWNNSRKEIRRSHRRDKSLNRRLREKLREVEKIRDDLEKKGKLNLDTLMSAISKDTDVKSLIHHAQKYRNRLDIENRYWEKRHFKVVIGNVERFIKERKKERKKQR